MGHHLSRVLSLLFVLPVAWAARAQHYFFENIAVQNGLPASKVYAILQDSTGLVWLGTEGGLASYDGNTVTSFGPSEHVAHNGALSLFQDRQKRLWVGHLGGGISLGQGHLFRTVAPDGAPLTRDVTGIAQDATGAVWVSTFGEGALRFTDVPADGPAKAERFGGGNGLSDRIISITRLRDGSLIFLEAEGDLQRWDAAAKRFMPYAPKGFPALPGITAVFEDSRGGLWIGTQSNGAVRLDPTSGTVTSYHIGTGLPGNFVFGFGEDDDGQVWVSTWDYGVARIEANGIRRFGTDNGTHSLKVRCIVRDREGNMLLGTHDGGLEIFKGDRFRSFTEEDHLVDKQVWAVLETSEGHLWFGTNGGITILMPARDGRSDVRHLTTQGGQLTSNHVRALKEDARGRIWIGTEDGGLFEFDPYSFRPNNDLEIAGSIAENKVNALEIGGSNEVWIGTINGLVRYAPGAIPVVLHASDGLAGENIIALFRDGKGTLWVGSANSGLSRVDNGKATRVDLGRTFSPTCFTQDGEGRLWIGTEGQGIVVLQDGKQVAAYDVDHGLASNSIRSLITDSDGQVWVGTNRGLNKWRSQSDSFLDYTERSGFIGIESKPNSVCRTRSGDLWFGTANGATRVGAGKDADRTVPPLVAIRGLKVNLEDRDPSDDVKLGHTERNVRIEYGSVSLTDPAAVRYQYYLEGLDNTWQPLTEETSAHYPALPAGHYVFKVKAMDRAGMFSERPAEFRFTVLPPWYRSWWAYSVLAVLIGVSSYSYVKFRERQLRLRNQVLERKVEQRTAEVVAQSREIAGQKVRIEELLLNILPRAVSDELRDTGRATARRFDDVTVMFTDMKGFTRVAEKMTPEQLVTELDECFARFDDITARYGIEKIKTIGDSYMCACGVPAADPHHAAKAVMAALDVREEMRRWHDEREAHGREAWVLRIGLHTGPVVAGVVGKRKFAYDIWGDTVNTASRMESSGEPGEVNISGTTYALVKDYFECEHRGQVEAKNKGRIDMYFVRRIRPAYSSDGRVPNERFFQAVGLPSADAVQQLA